jgi:hypothetical protein
VGIVLVVQVQASADNAAFPENYAKGVKWLVVVVDKAETKQVHELYAMPEPIEAAHKDQPMPNGAVFTVVRHVPKYRVCTNIVTPV